MITAQEVRDILHYDPETGIFTWKISMGRRAPAGARAGGLRADGYVKVEIHDRQYKASRLAWAYMTGEWPTGQVDHCDLDGSNDRWPNLREATGSQNTSNRRRFSSNTSGFKGVHWNKKKQKWRAQISAERRKYHLGYFDAAESAHAAYVTAAARLHGEFARTS